MLQFVRVSSWSRLWVNSNGWGVMFSVSKAGHGQAGVVSGLVGVDFPGVAGVSQVRQPSASSRRHHLRTARAMGHALVGERV